MGRPLPWAAFAARLAGGALALGLATLAGLLLADPYDSGRSPLSGAPGARALPPRTAAAGLGRDPRFEAAILGNSHAQLIDPARLEDTTGLAFVQLTMPGTGPDEQLAAAGWFLRHHPDARALVIGADPTWCTDNPALPPGHPFPYWLYDPSPWRYAAGLFRLTALEAALERPRAAARADGFRDYEPEFHRQDPAVRAAILARRAPDVPDPGRAGPFPAAGRLAALLAGAPPALRAVLVFPPVHAGALPRPGTPRDAAEAACKAALTGAVAGRGSVLDFRRAGASPDDTGLFFDQGHYRAPLARTLEAEIAVALARIGLLQPRDSTKP